MRKSLMFHNCGTTDNIKPDDALYYEQRMGQNNKQIANPPKSVRPLMENNKFFNQ